MFWRKKQGSSSSRGSVQDDWIARLPQHKHDFYESLVREWEDAYAILSVVLDEALAHRSRGELVRAREGVQVAAAVVNRLGEPLLAAYRTLEVRGRRLAAIPVVSPLNPEFFRGEAAQQNAHAEPTAASNFVREPFEVSSQVTGSRNDSLHGG